MKAKPKNPSTRSTKTDKPSHEIESEAGFNAGEESADDDSDTMSADEMAVFDQIMGEIEGREDGKPDHSAQPEPGGEKADAAAEARPAEKPPEETADGSEDLDEEQQKAFESIMAQIEDGDKGGDEEESPASSTDAPASTDDFSAQLEKVAKAADAGAETSAAEEHPDESADGSEDLDEEQQKAFESIMAQIEDGDKAPDEDGSPAPSTDAPASTDDIPAKQEMATEEAEAAAGDGTTKTGGDAVPDDADADSEDISEDIDDILQNITEDDESSLPTTADESEPEPTSETETLKAGDDEGPVAVEAKSAAAAVKDRHSSPPDAPGKGRSSPSTAQAPVDAPPDARPTDKKPRPEGSRPPRKANRLREVPPSATGRKKKLITASVLAVFVLALAGYLYWPQKGGSSVVKTPDAGQKVHRPSRDASTATAVPPSPSPVAVPQVPSGIQRLKTTAEKLDRLRNEMVAKQEEIQKLRAYYQDGINAEIQGIVDRLQQTGQGTVTLKAALADARIRLGLSAIQRRDAYIRKLKAPINELRRDGEALRFYSRKAGVLAIMAAKTSDIDVDGFIHQTDEIIKTYRRNLTQLSIDAASSPPTALKTIWKDIARHLSANAAAVNKHIDKHTDPADKDNARVWKQICDGDFSKKYKLTALSPAAARCLATWKGKDLFLDNLTDLSPQAAHALAAWKGEWLGLNGLTNLSPETARQLSRWKGRGLSLNGLTRLSPQIVAILSEWQGDQIELINVKAMSPWENPKTRLFLSEALKRKLGYTRK